LLLFVTKRAKTTDFENDYWFGFRYYLALFTEYFSYFRLLYLYAIGLEMLFPMDFQRIHLAYNFNCNLKQLYSLLSLYFTSLHFTSNFTTEKNQS
jgi:hypothetical protein